MTNKKKQKENFLRCRESCVCNEPVCKASAFKECSVCGDVMKSQCSKARCTVNSIRPLMKLSWYDTEKKYKKSSKKKKVNEILREALHNSTDDDVDDDDEDDEDDDDGDDDDDETDDFELESEVEEDYDVDEVDSNHQGGSSRFTEYEEQGGSSRFTEYGELMHYDDVQPGIWVVVVYEEEKFIGKVQHKKGGEVNVRCLEKPLGINTPQIFEPGEGIYYEKVYKTDIIPTQTQTDVDGKQKRKWFWVY